MADATTKEAVNITRNRLEGRPAEFVVRSLASSDFEQLRQLHTTIIDEVTEDVMDRRPDTYWQDLDASRGAIFGAFSDNRLVAYSCVEFSSDVGIWRARYVNDIPESELNNVAYCCGSGVHPDFRGADLHKRLSHERISHAFERGYFHALGAVSTRNPFSLRSHFKNDLLLKAIMPDEYGYGWFVHRDMRLSTPRLMPHSRVTADATDMTLQKELLSLGYRGVHVENISTHPLIEFAKFA